jgi:hypothetical protein
MAMLVAVFAPEVIAKFLFSIDSKIFRGGKCLRN